jgi:hypothetical protein
MGTRRKAEHRTDDDQYICRIHKTIPVIHIGASFLLHKDRADSCGFNCMYRRVSFHTHDDIKIHRYCEQMME